MLAQTILPVTPDESQAKPGQTPARKSRGCPEVHIDALRGKPED